MKDSKYGVLVAHVCLYAILTLVAFALSAVMGECKAKAQQVTKDWTMTEPREALTVGFKVDNYLFELGLEYRKAYEEEGVTYETFGAPMSFSYLHPMQYGDFTLTFGGGVGFMLEVVWSSEEYNILVETITYPGIETDTYLFIQTYVSLAYDVFIVTYHVKYSEDRIHPSLGIGFAW